MSYADTRGLAKKAIRISTNYPPNLHVKKGEKVTSWESSVKLIKLFRYVVCPTDEA